MVEPFKALYNPTLVRQIAQQLSLHYADFASTQFVDEVCAQLADLELKQRIDCICLALIRHLPDDFNHSAEIIERCLGARLQPCGPWQHSVETREGLVGWAIMPLMQYVSLQGIEQFERSMTVLKQGTQRASSEFAIRDFIERYPQQSLQLLLVWSQDPCQHVRRLVSEGSRPRLPWGKQLKAFIDDPSPLLPLLDALKDDPSDYVRRSVANSLNDIGKDHPDILLGLVQQWWVDASHQRQALIKHACRNLIKQGHPQILRLLGYHAVELSHCQLQLDKTQLYLGDSVQLQLQLTSGSEQTQALLIDYCLHHQKANGQTRGKVFKWRTLQLAAGQQRLLQKQHVIKTITTRNYYPGTHYLEVLINGKVMASASFELLLPQA